MSNIKFFRIKIIAFCSILFLSISMISLLNSYISLEEDFKINNKFENIKSSIYLEWDNILYDSSDSRTYDIAVDSEGSIYTTGYINTTDDDIFLRKYNSSGNLNWSIIINGSDGLGDRGYGVAVDNLDFVYVAGNIRNGSTYSATFLAKYDKNGNLQWNCSRLWETPLSSAEVSITIDSNNDIILGAILVNISTLNRIMGIIKFSTSGEYMWNATYSADPSTTTYCQDINVDSNNDIILVGYNQTISAYSDIQIVKFSSNGDQIWNKTYSQYDNQYAFGVAIDSDDNITIIAEDYSKEIMILIEYDPDGNFIYNKTIADITAFGTYREMGIEIDKSTDTIFCYGRVDNINRDAKIVCCNDTGDFQWNFTWDSSLPDSIWDICFDPLGYLYFIGESYNSSHAPKYGTFLVKYSLAPKEFNLVAQGYGNPDYDGNVYLNWTLYAPIDADNYTVYNFSNYITEINSSHGISVLETKQTGFLLENLDDGTYYFIVEAHNNYGNSTSNCITIDILLTPSSFTIECNASQPDDDGIFWLNWSKSDNARNYTIRFKQGNYIGTDVQTSGVFYDMVPSSIQSLQINSSILPNDNYSIRVWAHNYDDEFVNNVTQESSNYVTVSLGIPPGTLFPISISSPNAGNPDTDKEFILEYGQLLDKATHYEVYYSTSKTSDISKMNLLVNDTNRDRSFSVTEATALPDGTIYFIVVGFNAYGNYTSEILTLTLGIASGDGIPWWIYPIITGIISACVGIAIKQTYSSVKKRRIFMQNVQDKFAQIDNIENFLKEKLGYDEWQRLQGHVDKYKKHQISNKDLIKAGKKEIGKDFTDIFIGKKKPKK